MGNCFNIGDKIVCVQCGRFITKDGHKKRPSKVIKNGHIYTIISTGASNDYELDGIEGNYYHNERFVSLDEYRRLKINKIKNNVQKEVYK